MCFSYIWHSYKIRDNFVVFLFKTWLNTGWCKINLFENTHICKFICRVLEWLLAIFNTFNFISYKTGNFFSSPTNLTDAPAASWAAQGRSQKLKLTLLHGGFVLLLEGREFTASGIMTRDTTFILLYLTKILKLYFKEDTELYGVFLKTLSKQISKHGFEQ